MSALGDRLQQSFAGLARNTLAASEDRGADREGLTTGLSQAAKVFDLNAATSAGPGFPALLRAIGHIPAGTVGTGDGDGEEIDVEAVIRRFADPE